MSTLIDVERRKKTCHQGNRFLWPDRNPCFYSGCEFITHDVGDHADTLLFIEDRFPCRHFAESVGDTVVNEFGLVARGLELRCFAGVSAVAVAVAALAVPDLLA